MCFEHHEIQNQYFLDFFYSIICMLKLTKIAQISNFYSILGHLPVFQDLITQTRAKLGLKQRISLSENGIFL